jgi:hypothetical protein
MFGIDKNYVTMLKQCSTQSFIAGNSLISKHFGDSMTVSALLILLVSSHEICIKKAALEFNEHAEFNTFSLVGKL